METLTTSEAAELLEVNDSRVRQLIRSGDLPASRVGNGAHSIYLIRKIDAERWAKQRRPYRKSQ
jgi:excisionase family DNA binding protein